MIQVKISANDFRNTVVVSNNATIREILESNNIPYGSTQIALDGAPLNAGDFDKTLAQFNITDRCVLSSVIKTGNAL